MINTNYIETIDFGKTPIRRNFTEGAPQKAYLMSDGSCYEIRLDYKTNQPFAVEVDYYDEY